MHLHAPYISSSNQTRGAQLLLDTPERNVKASQHEVNETLYADLPFGTWYYLLALGLRLPQCLWNNFKPEARPKLRPERDQIYARSEPKFTPEANPRPAVVPVFIVCLLFCLPPRKVEDKLPFGQILGCYYFGLTQWSVFLHVHKVQWQQM